MALPASAKLLQDTSWLRALTRSCRKIAARPVADRIIADKAQQGTLDIKILIRRLTLPEEIIPTEER